MTQGESLADRVARKIHRAYGLPDPLAVPTVKPHISLLAQFGLWLNGLLWRDR